MLRRLVRAIGNALLVVLTVGAALAVCEATLRHLGPTYRYDLAAEPTLAEERLANSVYSLRHPTTRTRHDIRWNNLASRQHRNFDTNALRSSVNVAFFGDSYTENVLMAAPYSFTENLDYLLNAHSQENESSAPAPRVNVLNFGWSGVATDQQYLRYKASPIKDQIAHVFYVYCLNDQQSALFFINNSGELEQRAPVKPAAWMRALSKLHITYLAIDAWMRLVPSGLSQRDEDLAVFRALVLRWREEAEAHGAQFYVVLLPKRSPDDRFVQAKLPNTIEVVDLYECFEDLIPNYNYTDWRFATDGHWAEAANMVAAHCLYRFLESKLGLQPAKSDEEIAALRYAYYKAFVDTPGWVGERWMPSATWISQREVSAAETRSIAEKYLALDIDTQVLLARGDHYDLYFRSSDRSLLYAADNCDEVPERFFLHLYPANAEDLPADRVTAGFINDDFSVRGQYGSWRGEVGCEISRKLPRFPVAAVKTGQMGDDGSTPKWSANVPLGDRTVGGVDSDTVPEGEPLVRGSYDVYASRADRSLVYVKTSCDQDRIVRFFLHVYPENVDDLPVADAQAGFANHDFDLALSDTRNYEDTCVLRRPLPNVALAKVHTGQFVAESGKVLWSAEIPLTGVFDR